MHEEPCSVHVNSAHETIPNGTGFSAVPRKIEYHTGIWTNVKDRPTIILLLCVRTTRRDNLCFIAVQIFASRKKNCDSVGAYRRRTNVIENRQNLTSVVIHYSENETVAVQNEPNINAKAYDSDRYAIASRVHINERIIVISITSARRGNNTVAQCCNTTVDGQTR